MNITREISPEYLRWLYEREVFWFQRKRIPEPPFILYSGRRGRGKSLFLTRDAQRELAAGSLVLSNCHIYDPLSNRLAERWETAEGLMERVAEAVLADTPRIIIVFDEAQNHFDSRNWEKTPRWFRGFLAESRHFRVGVIAASQSVMGVDKRFRLLCDAMYRVTPAFPEQKHRLAWYHQMHMAENFDSIDEEARVAGKVKLRYMTARVFGGYGTGALPSAEDFAEAPSARLETLITLIRSHVSGLEGAALDRYEAAMGSG